LKKLHFSDFIDYNQFYRRIQQVQIPQKLLEAKRIHPSSEHGMPAIHVHVDQGSTLSIQTLQFNAQARPRVSNSDGLNNISDLHMYDVNWKICPSVFFSN
jgi:hypothetical protein